MEALFLGAKVKDVSTPLPSSPPVSSSSATVDAEILLKQALNVMTSELLEFLLLICDTKEPIFQADAEYQHQGLPGLSSGITRPTSWWSSIKPCSACSWYVMVPTLGLTLNEMQRDGQSMPNTGLLVIALSLILLGGDRVHEEKV